MTKSLFHRFHPFPSGAEVNAQASSQSVRDPLPHIQGTRRTGSQSDLASKRPATSGARHNELVQPIDSLTTATLQSADNANDKASRRYLSHTWRVINPRDDVETNVRPEHNSSSFFNYTKKVQPEYFFIHPDWYWWFLIKILAIHQQCRVLRPLLFVFCNTRFFSIQQQRIHDQEKHREKRSKRTTKKKLRDVCSTIRDDFSYAQHWISQP